MSNHESRGKPKLELLLPRARELTTATGARGRLEDHMRVGLGRRADRLVRNVHAPHGRNATPHGLATVDGLAPTRVKGCPDADLLEDAEGRRGRHGRAPHGIDLARIVQGEGR